MLPTFESKATSEEREQSLKWSAAQIQLILDQEKIEVPSKFTKIRCGCNKLVGWKFMYRCLYCGVWFCKDCAEEHFGFKAL
jgi:hypothetical protein